MKLRVTFLCVLLSDVHGQGLAAQETKSPAPPHTLDEAVQLALKHKHVVRIAGYKVEEKEHAKDVPRSGYFLCSAMTATPCE
jgi:hypothetical protein